MYFNVQFQCMDCGTYFEKAESPCGSGGSRCPKCDSTGFRTLGIEERKKVEKLLSMGFVPVNTDVLLKSA